MIAGISCAGGNSLRKASVKVLKELLEIQDGDFNLFKLTNYFNQDNCSIFLNEVLKCLGE